MKERIKIDSSILSFIIVITGVLFLFKDFYLASQGLDNILDCLGLILILTGNLMRMAARGHKKAHSRESKTLVTGGPYALVRNPMYLGSFLIGSGFAFLVWPPPALPVFAGIFYLRFNKEVLREEGVLSGHFGGEYKSYCKNTPRIFPSLKALKKIKTSEVFDLQEALDTKEARGIFLWPLLALLLESLQEVFVFGGTNIFITVTIFVFTIAVTLGGLWLSYRSS